MINTTKDTIAAISTPIGFGGIGIVRLSGPETAFITKKLFRKTAKKTACQKKSVSEWNFKKIIPRKLHYGYIVDPDRDTLYNEVLMVYMPAPNSYTREDVTEIQAHGGATVLKNILDLVIRHGARLAEPGEFSKRAYLNGRIDLSQAEAIIDVIQAKTETSLRIGNRNLEGDVGKTARRIRESLLEIKALMEVQIDFPEDVDEKIDEKKIQGKISNEILRSINKILEGYKHGRLIREGIKIVILGRTNVGKSSLLNRFLQQERAIVTSFPGTTRDSIEEGVNLFGIPAAIVDTAGWRNTNDPVEKIGIGRTCELAEKADMVLFMVDAGDGVVDEDEKLYLKIKKKEKILVINKTDLLTEKRCIEIPKNWNFSTKQYLSAKFGDGFEKLREKIYKKIIGSGNISETEIIPNLRQKILFQRTKKALEGALSCLKVKNQLELVTIDIQEAIEAIDEITGNSVKPDILDEIFSRFCIGK